MAISSNFPSQLVPESQKMSEDWGKQHLDYAEYLLTRRNNLFTTITRLYESYNGLKTSRWFNDFAKTMGKDNKAKLISYRLGRTKLDLLKGEWLKRPLRATVVTENIDSKSKKLDHADLLAGMMAAKEAIGKLREVGVDPLEGMQIPESEQDPLFAKMSYKDKNEDIMQIILNNGIKELDIQSKTTENFLDLLITAMCYGKVDISDEGKVSYWKIDPRDSIFAEVDNDPFLERCPLKGARFRFTVSEILRKYNLNKKQKETLEYMQNNPSRYMTGKKYNSLSYIQGDLCVDVIHIEWRSSRPEYYKLSPKTKRQLEIDPSTPYFIIEVKPEEYEANADKYMLIEEKSNTDMNSVFAQMANDSLLKNKIPVIVKYKEDIWEATRIGGVIDVEVRRKFFQLRKQDNPAYIIDLSYMGCLWGTIDGMRISLQQVLENFDNMFDITMYQILKELNRAKGKTLVINRGAIPKKKTVKDIIYQATNDGFIDVDWTADGYNGKEPVDIKHLITDFDIGFSSSFNQLLLLKNEIKATIDYLSGINDAREGETSASETVTNAQQNLNSSKTITEHLFFSMTKYTEKMLMRVCEAYKVSYAFYQVDKGKQILGDEKQNYLRITQELGYQDYGVYLQDGGRYAEYKQKINSFAEAALNTKEIHLLDLLNVELAETFVEAKKAFEGAIERNQKFAKEQQQREQEFTAQQEKEGREGAKEIQQQNFEQNLGGELKKIDTKGNKDIELQNVKDKNKMHLDFNKNEHEISKDQLTQKT